MAITNRNLPIGTVLEATFKKVAYRCSVEAGEEGRLQFKLDDGRTFNSPSAAASALMDGKAANGWRFWSVGGGEEDLAASREPAPAKATKPGRKKATLKQVRKVPNQANAPEGKARWFCSA